MRLKTPSFWYEEKGLRAAALMPLSFAYNTGRLVYQGLANPYKSNVPVICAGNLTAGGSGKTPVGLAVMRMIKDRMLAENPCFLTRGYGGRLKGPAPVDGEMHEAKDVGDEPLLLAKLAETIVCADRAKGARYAESHHYDLIVMDDGLQNPGLYKDIRLVAVDGTAGFGNAMTLPAGPLREPLAKGLERADAFVLIGGDKSGAGDLLPETKPVFRAKLDIAAEWIGDTKARYLAFCGLAHPDKFRRTLEQAGLYVDAFHAFPDHHFFTMKDLNALAAKADKNGARLLTTEKDGTRLPHDFTQHHAVDILPVRISWDEPEAVYSFLKDRLEAL